MANNKNYKKSLNQQIENKLSTMLHNGVGTSKKEAKADGTIKDKIFSYNTYNTYLKQCKHFSSWMKINHPEVTNLKKAKRFIFDYLKAQEKKENISAWTIHTKAKALGKLYGITQESKSFYLCPKRERKNIKRSRTDAIRDKHFSKTNNDELIKFCQGTGLRRTELTELRGGCLIHKSQLQPWLNKNPNPTRAKLVSDALRFKHSDYFILTKGKGGKYRFAPIIGENRDNIVDRIAHTPKGEKVWQYVNTNADIHSYRSDYATTLYKDYARPIESIPYDRVDTLGRKRQSEVYHCRKDEKGKKLDRVAMVTASKALGHNRVEVIANNYLRGL